jgi:hypothetical protein
MTVHDERLGTKLAINKNKGFYMYVCMWQKKNIVLWVAYLNNEDIIRERIE